ncbi:WbqC-like protein family protein [Sinomicrobium oceani]|uniref:WbqC-like protein family protein n=1 Tax=Sinomicrobium oceani TaxID=1150368 RepID=A0A1K1LNX8_9FLAO|nr:WbqC family protein [Sinomicrobium oceani]SFW12613.1 WbqC-like protein family protein [Sinomicrobium oceani]
MHPTYFPSVMHMVGIVNHRVTLEMHDNFQKQTYRNRMYVYGPGGKQLLSIPVKHSKTEDHQKYRDIRIEHDFNWRKQHWKTLETAYRTSPFFEFYEDDLAPIFEKKTVFLMDLNLETMTFLCDVLQIDPEYDKTSSYTKTISGRKDYRFMVDAKEEPAYELAPYTQVFAEKHGFISNLSMLDLLFNEGPNTLNYLEQQKLSGLY